MRRATLLLLLLLLAACAPSGPDVTASYAAAYGEFTMAVDAATAKAGNSTDVLVHQALMTDFAVAAGVFGSKLESIAFPEGVRDDADALIGAVVLAEQRARAAAIVSDRDLLAAREQEVVDALLAVSDKAASVRDALQP